MSPPYSGRSQMATPWTTPSEATVATIGVTFSVSMRTELNAPTARTAATRAATDLTTEPPETSGRVNDKITTVRLITEPMDMSKSPEMRLYDCAIATKASGRVPISQLLRLKVFQNTEFWLPV